LHVIIVFFRDVIEVFEWNDVMNIEGFPILFLSLATNTASIAIALAGSSALFSPIRTVIPFGSPSPLRTVFPNWYGSMPFILALKRAEMANTIDCAYSPGLSPNYFLTSSTFGFQRWRLKVWIFGTNKVYLSPFIIAFSAAKIMFIAFDLVSMTFNYFSALRASHIMKVSTISKVWVRFTNIMFAHILAFTSTIAKLVLGIFKPVRMPKQFLATVGAFDLDHYMLRRSHRPAGLHSPDSCHRVRRLANQRAYGGELKNAELCDNLIISGVLA
jgi:hypothetical protein